MCRAQSSPGPQMLLETWTQTPGCGPVAEGFTTLWLSFLACKMGTEVVPSSGVPVRHDMSHSRGLCMAGPRTYGAWWITQSPRGLQRSHFHPCPALPENKFHVTISMSLEPQPNVLHGQLRSRMKGALERGGGGRARVGGQRVYPL